MTTIATLIAGVIAREGGYSNRAADRGGATCWGITQATARANGYAGDMRALPQATAAAIYRAVYWQQPALDQVAMFVPDVAAELFDAAVNQGVSFACTALQRALNVLNRGHADYPDVPTDGHLGPVSIAALRGYRTHRADAEGAQVLLLAVRALRVARYVDIAEHDQTQEANEYGWLARLLRLDA